MESVHATEPLFLEDSYLSRCEAVVTAVSDEGFVTDQTNFYASSGGQPGDIGDASDGRQTYPVIDTRKYGTAGSILHYLGAGQPKPVLGQRLVLEVDWPRRHRLMRMHSCLHLLSSAVDGAVTGGSIGDGKGRLDFDLPQASPGKEPLQAQLLQWIAADLPITSRWIDQAELETRPELVKTMSVRPPVGQGRIRLIEIGGIDLQACGGTHVRSTGEIGVIRVAKIEKKGRQNRRIQLVLA